MNKITIKIWGREFVLPVEYEHYSNQEVLSIQYEAIDKFLYSTSEIDKSRKAAEEYCLSKNQNGIFSDSIDNVFKYIIPEYLFVKRSENMRTVAIMCNYRFDMEHGIAVIFNNEVFSRIVSQDVIL